MAFKSIIHVINLLGESLQQIFFSAGQQEYLEQGKGRAMCKKAQITIPLLGLSPKNLETPIQKNSCTPMFIAELFTIAKCWKQLKCPSVNEWMRKLWYIYTMEFYASERKKELLPFMTAWMELESIMLSEISQAVKDKYHRPHL